MEKKEPQSNNMEKSITFVKYLNLGWEITFGLFIPMGLGAFGGYYLDEYLYNQGYYEKEYPIFMVVFLLIGLALGFYNVFLLISRFDKENKEKKRKQEKQKGK